MLVLLHVPLRDRAAFHSASDDDDVSGSVVTAINVFVFCFSKRMGPTQLSGLHMQRYNDHSCVLILMSDDDFSSA